MAQHDIRSARRPAPDAPMAAIADYVADFEIRSEEAYDTARHVLMDSLGCAMLAMKFPECVKHLGPVVPGATMAGGVRVPGTSGPRCLTHSGNCNASSAQPSESISM